MKFYSGFSLKNDNHFFDEYIKDSEYNVCGFSYGAIKAYEEVKKRLKNNHRVDILQLFSPAFFQTKSEQFKNMQLRAYRKNQDIYLKQFINSCFFPYELKEVELSDDTTIDELDELLNYQWDIIGLKELCKQGIKIEIYIGGEDKIVDVTEVKEFFIEVADIIYIRNANHFLQIN